MSEQLLSNVVLLDNTPASVLLRFENKARYWNVPTPAFRGEQPVFVVVKTGKPQALETAIKSISRIQATVPSVNNCFCALLQFSTTVSQANPNSNPLDRSSHSVPLNVLIFERRATVGDVTVTVLAPSASAGASAAGTMRGNEFAKKLLLLCGRLYGADLYGSITLRNITADGLEADGGVRIIDMTELHRGHGDARDVASKATMLTSLGKSLLAVSGATESLQRQFLAATRSGGGKQPPLLGDFDHSVCTVTGALVSGETASREAGLKSYLRSQGKAFWRREQGPSTPASHKPATPALRSHATPQPLPPTATIPTTTPAPGPSPWSESGREATPAAAVTRLFHTAAAGVERRQDASGEDAPKPREYELDEKGLPVEVAVPVEVPSELSHPHAQPLKAIKTADDLHLADRPDTALSQQPLQARDVQLGWLGEDLTAALVREELGKVQECNPTLASTLEATLALYSQAKRIKGLILVYRELNGLDSSARYEKVLAAKGELESELVGGSIFAPDPEWILQEAILAVESVVSSLIAQAQDD